jgi:hypothetical protein
MIVHMAKKSTKTAVTNEKIMGYLVGIDERMVTKDDLAVVKEGLEVLKQDVKDIKDVVKPLSKAFDKDAKTTVQHEIRITAIERKLGVPTK